MVTIWTVVISLNYIFNNITHLIDLVPRSIFRSEHKLSGDPPFFFHELTVGYIYDHQSYAYCCYAHIFSDNTLLHNMQYSAEFNRCIFWHRSLAIDKQKTIVRNDQSVISMVYHVHLLVQTQFLSILENETKTWYVVGQHILNHRHTRAIFKGIFVWKCRRNVNKSCKFVICYNK